MEICDDCARYFDLILKTRHFSDQGKICCLGKPFAIINCCQEVRNIYFVYDGHTMLYDFANKSLVYLTSEGVFEIKTNNITSVKQLVVIYKKSLKNISFL